MSVAEAVGMYSCACVRAGAAPTTPLIPPFAGAPLSPCPCSPTKRISVEEALAHPYLKTLHCPEDEPVTARKFDFSFEVRVQRSCATTMNSTCAAVRG